jgi:hypothetical protein
MCMPGLTCDTGYATRRDDREWNLVVAYQSKAGDQEMMVERKGRAHTERAHGHKRRRVDVAEILVRELSQQRSASRSQSSGTKTRRVRALVRTRRRNSWAAA